MGTPGRPQPVKLICGLLSGDVDLLGRARQMLARRFGPIDLESPLWPFTQSDYYADELGDSIQRGFVSFDAPVDPQRLAEVKVETNALERRMAEECLSPGRVVNLDPGYIDLSKLVLATTKDRSHRVYLSQGIFAEATLHYAHDAWQAWPWTYPDYRSSDYHAFFSLVRARLLEQRRAREARA
jgi:hypothetical protein